MVKLGLTKVRLHEVANGYEFFLDGVTHSVTFEDGFWVLEGSGERVAFESFNEAMNAGVEAGGLE